MKILEVTEFEPAPGKEYVADGYPRNGAYILPNGTIVMVANGVAMQFHGLAYMLKDMPPSGGALGAPAAPAAGITEATLLKALAIAQNPALAVQLTSEPQA